MTLSSKKKQSEDPLFIDLLNDEDRIKYSELREQFSLPKYKNRRNKSNNVFKTMIQSIKSFIDKNETDKWKRSLVCGIVWVDDMIIINTHQLRILIDKCKSSINGSFQSIGYEALPSGEEYISHIISLYPFMKNNYAELRQWTARRKISPEKLKRRENLRSSLSNKQDTIIKDIQSQKFFPNTNEFHQSSFTWNQFNQINEISPAPDLTDINNDFSENKLFTFTKDNEIMDQCENIQIMKQDDNILNDDFLPFIPKFPNCIENEINEMKEFQNRFSFNDINDKLYM